MEGDATEKVSKGGDTSQAPQKQSRRTRARGGGGVRQKQKKSQKKESKKGSTEGLVLGANGQHDLANMATQMMLLHVGGQPVSVVPIMQMGMVPPSQTQTPQQPKNDGLNTKAKPFQPQGLAEREEQIAWSSAQTAAQQSKKELETAAADAVKAQERQKEKAAAKRVETPPPPMSPDSEPTTPTIAASVLQQLDLYDHNIVMGPPSTTGSSVDDVVLDFPWKDDFTLPSQAQDLDGLEVLESLEPELDHEETTPILDSLPQPKQKNQKKKKNKKLKDQDRDSKEDEVIEISSDPKPEITADMMQPFLVPGGMVPPIMMPMLVNNGVMMPQPMLFPGAGVPGMMPVGAMGMGAMGVPLLPMTTFPGMPADLAAQFGALPTGEIKEGELPKHVMDFFPGSGTGMDPPVTAPPPVFDQKDNNVLDFFKSANIIQAEMIPVDDVSDMQSPESIPDHNPDSGSVGLEAFMNANSIGTG